MALVDRLLLFAGRPKKVEYPKETKRESPFRNSFEGVAVEIIEIDTFNVSKV